MNLRIREIRKKFNYTQTQFAEKIGTTRNVIANIESGRVVPNDIFINFISKEFHINKDWIINGTGEMEASDMSAEDIVLADIFADLTVNKNSKLRSIIEKAYKLDDEYLDLIENLIIGLNKK